jgi:hypothetical protein
LLPLRQACHVCLRSIRSFKSGTGIFVRCTECRVATALRRSAKLSRVLRLAPPARRLSLRDPQCPPPRLLRRARSVGATATTNLVVRGSPEVTKSPPVDRGYYPRGHGHPSAVSKKRGKGYFRPPIYDGKPKAGPSPVSSKSIIGGSKGRESHDVRLEPLLLRGVYNNPRKQLWKKVESKAQRSGIVFHSPLPFKAVRCLYQMSHLLYDLHLLCDKVGDHNVSLKDAVFLFHKTRRFFQNSVGFTPGSVVDARLRGCALSLRFAKSKQRLTGRSF